MLCYRHGLFLFPVQTFPMETFRRRHRGGGWIAGAEAEDAALPSARRSDRSSSPPLESPPFWTVCWRWFDLLVMVYGAIACADIFVGSSSVASAESCLRFLDFALTMDPAGKVVSVSTAAAAVAPGTVTAAADVVAEDVPTLSLPSLRCRFSFLSLLCFVGVAMLASVVPSASPLVAMLGEVCWALVLLELTSSLTGVRFECSVFRLTGDAARGEACSEFTTSELSSSTTGRLFGFLLFFCFVGVEGMAAVSLANSLSTAAKEACFDFDALGAA